MQVRLLLLEPPRRLAVPPSRMVVHSGPHLRTVQKNLAAIGRHNVQMCTKQVQQAVCAHVMANSLDAITIHELIQQKQLPVLRGEVQAEDDRELPASMNKMGVLSLRIKKRALLELTSMSPKFLREAQVKDPGAVDAIFTYCFCNDPSEAIPKKYSEGRVLADIKLRATAAGERWKQLRWEDGRVLWPECGVYQLERGGGGELQVFHFFSKTAVPA